MTDSCNGRFEQLCENDPTWRYNSSERYIDDLRTIKPIGSMTFGGYSQYIVSNLPKNLDIKSAAPLLYAVITMYYPLKKYQLGPGKTVGIARIGGLVHLGIKMAKAMGCKVEDSRIKLKTDDSVLMTDLSKINGYNSYPS